MYFIVIGSIELKSQKKSKENTEIKQRGKSEQISLHTTKYNSHQAPEHHQALFSFH